MNLKTHLLEEYVNFVDSTKRQNKYLRICITIFVLIMLLLTIVRVIR